MRWYLHNLVLKENHLIFKVIDSRETDLIPEQSMLSITLADTRKYGDD